MHGAAWGNEMPTTITMKALGGGSHLLRVLSRTLRDSCYCCCCGVPGFVTATLDIS